MKKFRQLFVLMKAFRLCLQITYSRRLQDEYIQIDHACSEDIFKMSKTNVLVLVICFQEVFKTFSRGLAKKSSRHLQDVLQRCYLKRLRNFLQRCLQDILKMFSRRLLNAFKMYHQVKVFLLTRLQYVFKTYSRHFWDVLRRRLSIERFVKIHFWETFGQGTNFPRVNTIFKTL